MEVQVNDTWLRGKFRITKKDVLSLLPEEIKEQVTNIHVRIDYGLPRWVLSTDKPGVSFVYIPFSGWVKEARYVKFGQIYLYRKGRYLRDDYMHKGSNKKVYAVYLCTEQTMYLLKEVKEYWFDDGTGLGCGVISKWFRAFP